MSTMERFATSCLFSKIPKNVELYSKAIVGKNITSAPITHYTSDLLLRDAGLQNLPAILHGCVLSPQLLIFQKHKAFEFSAPLAQHGYLKRNVATIASVRYVLETIVPFLPRETSAISLLVSSMAKNAMQNFSEDIYGLLPNDSPLSQIELIRKDSAALFAKLMSLEHQDLLEPEGADYIDLKKLPNLHKRFDPESEILLGVFHSLQKKNKVCTFSSEDLSALKVWACYVTLARASEALHSGSVNAEHEALLAARFCSQVIREISETKCTDDCMKKNARVLKAHHEGVTDSINEHWVHPIC